MSIDWFRWHHGSISEPKFTVVARKSGQPRVLVIATWAALLETASQAEDRGSLEEVEIDTIAACLDVEEDAVFAIYQAMVAKGLIVDGRVESWNRRQVYREDDSRDRVRRFREKTQKEVTGNGKKRDVTQDNAPVTPQNTDTDQIQSRAEQRERAYCASAHDALPQNALPSRSRRDARTASMGHRARLPRKPRPAHRPIPGQIHRQRLPVRRLGRGAAQCDPR